MSVTRFLMLGCLMLCASLLYVNPAPAAVIYTFNMTGPAESPPNASPGIGSGTVTFDDVARTMRVQASFSGLTGNTTAAHIHSAPQLTANQTAGVATQLPSFVGFPLGVTNGSMDQTYDMSLASSFNPAYVTANGGTETAAFTALMNQASQGIAYFNIHTSTFGGGEIRGFLTAVPEPSGLLLTGSLLAGLIFRRQRRR